jgi:hypothetical protein
VRDHDKYIGKEEDVAIKDEEEDVKIQEGDDDEDVIISEDDESIGEEEYYSTLGLLLPPF